MTDNTPVSQLPDSAQIKILLEQMTLHLNSQKHAKPFQLIRLFKRLENDIGRITPELAKRVIKNRANLMLLQRHYHPTPYWLESFIGLYLAGNIKLEGGQENYPVWACRGGRELDIVWIYDTLFNEFGFAKGDIYVAIAEFLQVAGRNELADNGKTIGYETVRQHIQKKEKQYKSIIKLANNSK